MLCQRGNWGCPTPTLLQLRMPQPNTQLTLCQLDIEANSRQPACVILPVPGPRPEVHAYMDTDTVRPASLVRL